MRILLFIIISLAGCSRPQAANYYFSTLIGDDSRSALMAQSPATPWKTLSKLNEIMNTLLPGDMVLFKRGERFEGNIDVSKSGSSGSPITFSAFGVGTRPVIDGFRTITSWASKGSNLYEAPLSSGASLNMVTINGIVQAMGRYPNYNAADGGFLTIDSHNGTIYITDADLAASPNWTGAEVVIRKVEWVLDRNTITSHSGNTITYTSSTGHQPADGNGYFIQNSLLALDRQGEWYYDEPGGRLVLYSTTNPTALAVKASVNDNLVSLVNMGNIVFDNLAFEGADKEAFRIQGSNNITIQNCSIHYTGIDAISAMASSRVTVYNNTIDHSNNSGIRTGMGCSNSLIRKNTVNHSGLLPGMGLSNNQQMVGIFAGDGATVSTIDSNTVRNSGYCGISFTGDSTVVKNNLVDSFCLTVHDGGGIYTWGGHDKVARKIIRNIVLHGIGQPHGTRSTVPGGAIGIYVDDRSTNIEILDNTVAFNSRAGIILHNAHEITVKDNTLFNNAVQISLLHDKAEPQDPIRNIVLSNNILFSKLAEQFIGEHGSVTNDISQFGSFNNNYYVRPLDENGILGVNYINGTLGTAYSYHDRAGWSATYGHDLQSKSSPQAIAPYTVTSTSGSSKFINTAFSQNINGVTCFGAANCLISWSPGGKLDGGALKIASGSATASRQFVYFDIGSMNAATNYLVKFSMQGSFSNRTIQAYIRNASFYTVSPVKYFTIGTTRSEAEFLFTSGAAMNGAFLVIELLEKDGPIWLDNLDIRSANAVITNPDEHIRFEYNSGNVNRQVLLSSPHIDARNVKYQTSVSIAPFSSVVLIKVSSKGKK